MGKISIAINKHNIRNIIWNIQGYKTAMTIGIREKNSQGWTWTVATWLRYISCMLDFLANFT